MFRPRWSHISFLSVFLLAALALVAQDKTQKRDLKIVPDGQPGEQELVTPTGQPVTIPRSYALVVGVADYKNLPDKSLKFSERDAEAIYSILISPEGGNFRAQNVHILKGAKATRANIQHELEEWLPSVAKPEDRVLIYFAGHGFVYDGRAYLAPYDIHPDDIPGTGYPMESLGKVIGSKIQARHKVLLTDSCHSGAITPEAEAENNAAINSSLLDLNTSLFSLTASRDRESSYESAEWGGGHGIFTYYVVKGLEGEADENADGIVTADELAEYSRRNVRDATGARQNPTSDRGSFDPNMPLAYIPKLLTKVEPQQPDAKFGGLVFETNMDGVEVFIDGKSAGVVNKEAPLRIPGLQPGAHTVKGVKLGYEPDGPREEMVYPGQEKTVSFKILYARRRKRSAVDALDKGIEFYEKGFARNYEKAAEYFEKAFSEDPTYSQAALYLGRTYSALFEYEKAEQYYRKALKIDPDYLEAEAAFGGMLLDTGNFDESIRQLVRVIQREPDHRMAHSMLAQAYRMKDMYPESIESAHRAIELDPDVAEPHFFLADSLRMSDKPAESKPEYEQYLELSDFESSTSGKVFNYWLRGFLIGQGKKTRATQKDIWNDLRSLAYFGLGDAERLLSHPDPAIANHQKSLGLDDQDPKVHYALALAFTHKTELTGDTAYLAEAVTHFRKVVELNEYLAEAEQSRKYIAKIDTLLQAQR